MYGTPSAPLVPLTGFSVSAGTFAILGYPVLAISASVLAGLLTGFLLVKFATRKKTLA